MEMLVRDAGGTAGSSPVISLDDRQGHDPVLSQKRMRVALVGNFAPRKCGIATFTTDIFERLGEHHPEVRLQVYALQDPAAPVAHQVRGLEVAVDDAHLVDRAQPVGHLERGAPGLVVRQAAALALAKLLEPLHQLVSFLEL